MSSIGGWLILFGLVLVVWLVIYTIRRNPRKLRPAGPSLQVVQSTGPGKGHGSKHTLLSLFAAVALLVFIIAGGLYIISWLPAVGDTVFRLAGIKVVQPQQVINVPRAYTGSTVVRYTNELPCPPWDRTRHVCTLSGTTDIVQAAGLPAGLTFCMTPGPDLTKADSKDLRWKGIRAIRDNGDRIDLDPAHPLTNLAGYELTPTHPLPVTYWFSDSPSCT